MVTWRRQLAVLLVVLGSLGAAAAPAGAEPLIAAAGDIACDPATSGFNAGAGTATACRQQHTANLLETLNLTAVLPLGDLQYECGGYDAFLQSYAPSWGRLKGITYPTPGNHEYQVSGGTGCDATQSALGYYDYFGTAAGDRTKGYYSYNVGSWHIVALNSNCSVVSCSTGSAQEQWLRQDLAASTAKCTLAYWHHPLFSSGKYHPGVKSVTPLFQALHDHEADVVLSGHDHIYERFAPQTPAGTLHRARGIRQFTVGTGGRSLQESLRPIANSEKRGYSTFGVLTLRLLPTSYRWAFVPEAGGTFRDSGSDDCEGTAPDTVAPSAPPGLTGSATASNLVDLNWSATADNVGVIAYRIFRNGSVLANTTARTSYSDESAAPGTTYTYEVRARDAAGNLSEPSNSVTVTTPPSTVSVALAPEADARVEQSDRSSNFGESILRVDAGTGIYVRSYLRFTVAATAPVKSARVRLYAFGATSNGPALYGTANTWTETGITWNNKPSLATAAFDDKGPIDANGWVDYNATSLVPGSGTYTFAVASSSTDGVDFYSREGPNLRPRLVLGY